MTAIGPYTRRVLENPSLLFDPSSQEQFPWSWDAFLYLPLCQEFSEDTEHRPALESIRDITFSPTKRSVQIVIPCEEFVEWVLNNDINAKVYHCWSDGVAIMYRDESSLAHSRLRWEDHISYATTPYRKISFI